MRKGEIETFLELIGNLSSEAFIILDTLVFYFKTEAQGIKVILGSLRLCLKGRGLKGKATLM